MKTEVLPEDGIVDEIAIELAIEGVRVRLTARERSEAIRILNGRGWTDGAIATRLSLGYVSVWRIRQRDGIPSIHADQPASQTSAASAV